MQGKSKNISFRGDITIVTIYFGYRMIYFFFLSIGSILVQSFFLLSETTAPDRNNSSIIQFKHSRGIPDNQEP